MKRADTIPERFPLAVPFTLPQRWHAGTRRILSRPEGNLSLEQREQVDVRQGTAGLDRAARAERAREVGQAGELTAEGGPGGSSAPGPEGLAGPSKLCADDGRPAGPQHGGRESARDQTERVARYVEAGQLSAPGRAHAVIGPRGRDVAAPPAAQAGAQAQ